VDGGGVTSKMSKKTPTPPEKKSPTPAGKKSPAAPVGGAGGSETPGGSQPFPEADPGEPNKNKVTPDCASIDVTQVLTMSQLLQYFVHAQNLDED